MKPKQVINSRWDSRTKVTRGTCPFESKNVFHDSFSEYNQCLLACEVAYDTVVEYEDVFSEGRMKEC